MIRNALTIDVEDWHQLVEWKLNGVLPACSAHVVDQTRVILDILAQRGVRATFFVLGLVARAFPKLVRDIHAAGHEVGSHGWSHTLIYRQSPEEFAAETKQAKDTLEDILGDRVRGYRAAEFSITRRSIWALSILADLGFAYDSSVFPIDGARYGIPDAPVRPYRAAGSGSGMMELPLTVLEWGSRRYPVGGGGYFRILPYWVTRAAIGRVNTAGRAAVAYFHPYEFSAELLIPRKASARAILTGGRYLVFHNLNRHRNRRRFGRLLDDYRFTTAAEVLGLG